MAGKVCAGVNELTHLDKVLKEAPEWIYDMELCHIADDPDPDVALCGEYVGNSGWCPDYDWTAICPGCGCPTCPRCVQLLSLEKALNG